MTFPVSGPTTADLLRAFAVITHDLATERDQARAELEEQRKLSASLGLDNRALKDRLKEAGALVAEHEQLRAGQAADIAYLQRAANDQPTAPAERPHTGPPGRCLPCGIVHGHAQAIALTAAGRDRIEANK